MVFTKQYTIFIIGSQDIVVQTDRGKQVGMHTVLFPLGISCNTMEEAEQELKKEKYVGKNFAIIPTVFRTTQVQKNITRN